MENRITTAKIEDLISIFDPAAQEESDAGDARILYVFDDNETPQRVRVGSTFILDVLSPAISFFISAPVVGNIDRGTLAFAQPVEDGEDRYQLTKQDLERVIQIAYSVAGGEDQIDALLDS